MSDNVMKKYVIEIDAKIDKAEETINKLEKQMEGFAKDKALAQSITSQIDSAKKSIADLKSFSEKSFKALQQSINKLDTSKINKQFDNVTKQLDNSISKIEKQVELLSSVVNSSDATKLDQFVAKLSKPFADLTIAIERATDALNNFNTIEIIPAVNKKGLQQTTANIDTLVSAINNLKKVAKKNDVEIFSDMGSDEKSILAIQSAIEQVIMSAEGLSDLDVAKTLTDQLGGSLKALKNYNKRLSAEFNEIVGNVGTPRGDYNTSGVKPIERNITIKYTLDKENSQDIDEIVKDITENIIPRINEKLDKNQAFAKIKISADSDQTKNKLKKIVNQAINELNSDEAFTKIEVDFGNIDSQITDLIGKIENKFKEADINANVNLGGSSTIDNIDILAKDSTLQEIKTILSSGLKVVHGDATNIGQTLTDVSTSTTEEKTKGFEEYSRGRRRGFIQKDLQDMAQHTSDNLRTIDALKNGSKDISTITKALKNSSLTMEEVLDQVEQTKYFSQGITLKDKEGKEIQYSRYAGIFNKEQKPVELSEFQKELKDTVTEAKKQVEQVRLDTAKDFDAIRAGKYTIELVDKVFQTEEEANAELQKILHSKDYTKDELKQIKEANLSGGAVRAIAFRNYQLGAGLQDTQYKIQFPEKKIDWKRIVKEQMEKSQGESVWLTKSGSFKQSALKANLGQTQQFQLEAQQLIEQDYEQFQKEQAEIDKQYQEASEKYRNASKKRTDFLNQLAQEHQSEISSIDEDIKILEDIGSSLEKSNNGENVGTTGHSNVTFKGKVVDYQEKLDELRTRREEILATYLPNNIVDEFLSAQKEYDSSIKKNSSHVYNETNITDALRRVINNRLNTLLSQVDESNSLTPEYEEYLKEAQKEATQAAVDSVLSPLTQIKDDFEQREKSIKGEYKAASNKILGKTAEEQYHKFGSLLTEIPAEEIYRDYIRNQLQVLNPDAIDTIIKQLLDKTFQQTTRTAGDSEDLITPYITGINDIRQAVSTLTDILQMSYKEQYEGLSEEQKLWENQKNIIQQIQEYKSKGQEVPENLKKELALSDALIKDQTKLSELYDRRAQIETELIAAQRTGNLNATKNATQALSQLNIEVENLDRISVDDFIDQNLDDYLIKINDELHNIQESQKSLTKQARGVSNNIFGSAISRLTSNKSYDATVAEYTEKSSRLNSLRSRLKPTIDKKSGKAKVVNDFSALTPNEAQEYHNLTKQVANLRLAMVLYEKQQAAVGEEVKQTSNALDEEAKKMAVVGKYGALYNVEGLEIRRNAQGVNRATQNTDNNPFKALTQEELLQQQKNWELLDKQISNKSIDASLEAQQEFVTTMINKTLDAYRKELDQIKGKIEAEESKGNEANRGYLRNLYNRGHDLASNIYYLGDDKHNISKVEYEKFKVETETQAKINQAQEQIVELGNQSEHLEQEVLKNLERRLNEEFEYNKAVNKLSTLTGIRDKARQKLQSAVDLPEGQYKSEEVAKNLKIVEESEKRIKEAELQIAKYEKAKSESIEQSLINNVKLLRTNQEQLEIKKQEKDANKIQIDQLRKSGKADTQEHNELVNYGLALNSEINRLEGLILQTNKDITSFLDSDIIKSSLNERLQSLQQQKQRNLRQINLESKKVQTPETESARLHLAETNQALDNEIARIKNTISQIDQNLLNGQELIEEYVNVQQSINNQQRRISRLSNEEVQSGEARAHWEALLADQFEDSVKTAEQEKLLVRKNLLLANAEIEQRANGVQEVESQVKTDKQITYKKAEILDKLQNDLGIASKEKREELFATGTWTKSGRSYKISEQEYQDFINPLLGERRKAIADAISSQKKQNEVVESTTTILEKLREEDKKQWLSRTNYRTPDQQKADARQKEWEKQNAYRYAGLNDYELKKVRQYNKWHGIVSNNPDASDKAKHIYEKLSEVIQKFSNIIFDEKGYAISKVSKEEFASSGSKYISNKYLSNLFGVPIGDIDEGVLATEKTLRAILDVLSKYTGVKPTYNSNRNQNNQELSDYAKLKKILGGELGVLNQKGKFKGKRGTNVYNANAEKFREEAIKRGYAVAAPTQRNKYNIDITEQGIEYIKQHANALKADTQALKEDTDSFRKLYEHKAKALSLWNDEKGKVSGGSQKEAKTNRQAVYSAMQQEGWIDTENKLTEAGLKAARALEQQANVVQQSVQTTQEGEVTTEQLQAALSSTTQALSALIQSINERDDLSPEQRQAANESIAKLQENQRNIQRQIEQQSEQQLEIDKQTTLTKQEVLDKLKAEANLTGKQAETLFSSANFTKSGRGYSITEDQYSNLLSQAKQNEEVEKINKVADSAKKATVEVDNLKHKIIELLNSKDSVNSNDLNNLLGLTNKKDISFMNSKFVEAMFSSITNEEKANYLYDAYKSLGKQSDQAVADGIAENASVISDATKKSVQQGVVDTSKEVLDEHSPSKTAEQIGLYYVKGLSQGIEKGVPGVIQAVKNALSAAEISEKDIDELLKHLSSYISGTNRPDATRILGTFKTIKNNKSIKNKYTNDLSYSNLLNALKQYKNPTNPYLGQSVQDLEKALNKENNLIEKCTKSELKRNEHLRKAQQITEALTVANENLAKSEEKVAEAEAKSNTQKEQKVKLSAREKYANDFDPSVATEKQLKRALGRYEDAKTLNRPSEVSAWEPKIEAIQQRLNQIDAERKQHLEEQKQILLEIVKFEEGQNASLEHANNIAESLGLHLDDIRNVSVKNTGLNNIWSFQSQNQKYSVREFLDDDNQLQYQIVHIEELNNEYTQLQNTIKGLSGVLNKYGDISNYLPTMFGNLAPQVKEAQQLIADLTNIKNNGTADNIKDITDKVDRLKEIALQIKGKNGIVGVIAQLTEAETNSVDARKKSLADLALQYADGEIQAYNFAKSNSELTYSVRTADDQLKVYAMTIDQTGQVTQRLISQTKYVGTLGKLFQSFGKKFGELIRYTTASLSFWRVINMIKSGVNVVKELDTAMTEMQKVSNDTQEALDKFAVSSHKMAQEIGSTAAVIQNSAADWLRLGYNIKEAADLSKNTAILMNVSEFESIDAATESMVAMVQAFKDTNKDVGDLSLEIIDKLNNIGNNFSISTSDLAKSLQRSSGALIAAGNNLDEAIALTTAANAIIQDPESTGSALKVISMRLRGTSVKELEEAGEDTEGVIETVSKLEAKIKELTAINGQLGISILDANGNYRDTYEILQDIADIWEEIGEADKRDGQNRQAALLEAMAGKTRSQSLASLLQNPDMLRQVYEASKVSKGSAQKENEKYLDSIEAHVQILTAKWQEFWNSTLNRKQINAVLDLAGKLLDIATKLGSIPTASILLGGGISLKHFANKRLGQDPLGSQTSGNATLIEKITNSLSSFKKTNKEAFADASQSAEQYGKKVLIADKSLKEIIKTSTFAKIAIAGIIVAGVIAAWDLFTTTVKEAEEELDKTKSKISELETEIEALEDIGYRNSEQEERLRLLQQELEIQKQIAEQQERQIANEKLKKNIASFTDKDSYVFEATRLNFKSGYLGSKFEQDLEDYKKVKDIIYNPSEEAGDLRRQNKAKHDLRDDVAELEKLTTEYYNHYKEYQNIIDSGIYVEGDSKLEDAREAAEFFKSQYDAYMEDLREGQKILGIYDYNQSIENVISEYDGLKDKLLELQSEGRITQDIIEKILKDPANNGTSLSRYLTEDVANALNEASVDAETLYNWLMNIADPDRAKKNKILSLIRGNGGNTTSYDSSYIEQMFKSAGFDLNEEETQELALKVSAKIGDDKIGYLTATDWLKYFKDEIEQEKEIKVRTPSLKALLDQDGSFIDDWESELETTKTELRRLRNEQNKLKSQYLGNVDTTHRNTIYWNDENIRKYNKQLTSLGYDLENLKGSYSTTMFRNERMYDGRYITVTPILPDGSILTQDELTEYLQKISKMAHGDADLMLKLDASEIDGKKYGVIAGISDIGSEAGRNLSKEIKTGFEEASKNSETANELAEAMTTTILEAYNLTKDTLYDEDYDEIYKIIYDRIIESFASKTVDNDTKWSKLIFNKNYSDKSIWSEFFNLNDADILGWTEHLSQADTYQQQYDLLQKIDDLETKISNNANADRTDYTKYRDELIGLAQAGKLDEDTLKEYEHLSELLEAIGYSAELSDDNVKELLETINELANKNTVDQLKNYGDHIGVLDEAYLNYKEGKRIDATQLEAIQEQFGDLESYVDFSNAVMRGEKNLQQYFDAIVTEAVAMGNEYGNVFDGLTRENQDFWVKEMTDKGIKNALQASEEYLNFEEITYKKVVGQLEQINTVIKENNPISETDLDNATWKEIEALSTEADELGVLTDAFANFALQKYRESQEDIDTTEDCEALKNLADQAGKTAEVLELIDALENTLARRDAAKASGQVLMYSGLDAEAKRLNAEIQNALKEEPPQIELSFFGSKDAAENAGKDDADAYLEAFNKELGELDALKDAGVIGEKEYLERLRALYIKYFSDKKKYYQQFKQYEKQYLEGLKELYASAISASITILNDRKDEIEKQKDETIKTIEEQRDSETKAIQESIDNLEDEKEALEKANEERGKAMNLQKAQYELERAHSQRTRLIYKNGQMQYVNDSAAVRDAKNNVDDLLRQRAVDELDDKIDGLNKQLEEVEDHYSKLIEETEKMYDEQVEGVQKLIDMWEKLQHEAELVEVYESLNQFGITSEDILSGNLDKFNLIKDGYTGVFAGLSNDIDAVAKAFGTTTDQATAFKDALLGYDATTQAFSNMDVTLKDVGYAAKEAAKAIGDDNDFQTPSGGISVVGATKTLGSTVDTVVDDAIGRFESWHTTITNCASDLKDLADQVNKMNMPKYDENGFKLNPVFRGTAYASGNWSAKSKGADGVALTGELGQELVVDSRTGHWHTVGDNGAEFAKIKSSDIVFNHKQTEELLKNGKINSRGKAYASGNNKFTALSSEELSKYNKLDFTKDLAEKLDFGNQKLMNIDKMVSNISTTKTVNSNPVFNIDNTFTCNGVSLADIQNELAKSFQGIFEAAYQKAMTK